MMPRVDIGELILEVMSWQPRFLQAFTALSGGERRLDNLNVSIAAALTAQALNIGYGPVITPGVEALTRDRISHVDQSYLRADTVAPANAPLIEAQADIALARDHWGGGLVAAVDGIRFVVPVRSIDARPNPKYFGRRRGATWLNLINDVGAGLAGMVVSGTARDSLHIIDLIHRQEAGQRPEVIISDAGAYSDVVFGLLHLLNFDYRPQPADLPDTKLWCIDGSADYGPLATATRGRIDLAKIPRPLARLSPHRGVDPHRCQRPRRDPDACPGRELHAAGRGPGPLRAGLQNAARPLLRRRGAVPTQIKGMRNLQEGRHDLGRHLFHGRKGELRQAYQEGMEDQLGALGLALNCVVLWNSVYLDAAVARLRADGYPVREEDLARLSPYIRKHINVQGHTSSNYRTFAPTESQRFGRARGLTGIRGRTLAL